MNIFGTSLELVLRMAARHDTNAFVGDGRARETTKNGSRGERGGGWWSNAVRMWAYHGQTFPRQ